MIKQVILGIMYGFQFLIGRLGTILKILPKIIYMAFQFLIGRLGTLGLDLYFIIYLSFNSS